jgi:biopolymer transport protein TolR
MAMSVKTGMRGGRSRSKRGIQPMAEINVTPFVDVMLVLLIVFMVTAPLLTVGVPVDLPQTRARALNQDVEPLSVTVDSEGRVFLQNTPVELGELVPKLEAIAANGYDQRIFVRGEERVSYGKVMEVMGLLNTAGFSRVGLVTQTPRPAAPQ